VCIDKKKEKEKKQHSDSAML